MKFSNIEISTLLSGNSFLITQFISQTYAGHQFGHFTNLGDGGVLGEHITKSGKRLDIQFKGSGPTPILVKEMEKLLLGPMLRNIL